MPSHLPPVSPWIICFLGVAVMPLGGHAHHSHGRFFQGLSAVKSGSQRGRVVTLTPTFLVQVGRGFLYGLGVHGAFSAHGARK